MSWLHSQQSKFVFTVPILLEGTIYILYINIQIYSDFIISDFSDFIIHLCDFIITVLSIKNKNKNQ